MMKYFSIILAVIAFSSCEKVIDMDIPDKGRRPVINCLISEGGVPEVCIHRSRYILDNTWQFDAINNAVVIISYPGGVTDTLTQTSPGSTYKSNSQLAGNGSYNLYVSAEGYQVTAKTEIPVPVSINGADTGTMVIDNNHYLRVDLKFSDPPGSRNYYMAGIEREGESGVWYSVFATTSDMNASGEYHDKVLFKDDLFDGLNKSFRLEIYKNDLWSQQDSVNLLVKLYSLSYDCFMYMLTAEQAGYDSPFMEPVVVYTNVKEGYGIFAGYSVAVLPVKVPAFNGPVWQK
jgi:hypothetical protein